MQKGKINMAINEFRGTNFFLSNFYNCPVTYNGNTYQNAEAAFHAQKDPARSKEFTKMNPSEAKRLGRRVKLRKDWEQVKNKIMYEIVTEKFRQNLELAKRLLDTGDNILVEGNTWNDTYWGICNGRGKNHLGQILMRVRKELRQELREKRNNGLRRNDYTIEFCPYCENEVYIHATGITKCPECGKPLAPCSVCMEEHIGCHATQGATQPCPYGCQCDNTDEYKKATMPPLKEEEINFCKKTL